MIQGAARPKVLLVALNTVWAAVFLTVLLMFVLAVPARIHDLSQDPYGLGPSLRAMGLTMRAFAVYAALFSGLVMLAFILTSALIFLGKRGDDVAILASLALLLMGQSILPLTASLYRANPNWYWPVMVFRVVGLVMTLNLMYVFPNGRFIPSWTRLALPASFFSGLLMIWPGWQPPTVFLEFNALSDYLAFAITLFWLGTGAYAQIYRYRKLSSAAERQQTKWVVMGFAATVVIMLVVLLPRALFPALRFGWDLTLYTLVEIPLVLLALLFIPVSITISIFRYRLWDIDVIIRRTLIYSLLSGSLVLVYFSSVVLLQQILPAESPIAIVLSTLAIAALFSPTRGRIQNTIDKRFYRRKYDARLTLAAFGVKMRDEVELEQLSQAILAAVDETMQPAHASLWFRK